MKRYDLVTNYRCGDAIEEMEPSDDGEWLRYDGVKAQLAAGEARAAALQQELDEAQALNHEYDRAMCATNDAIHRVERVAGMIGAGSFALRLDGIAQQSEALREDLTTLQHQLREHQKDVAYHAECRPNRRQAEAAIADAKAMNDKWADEVTARRAAEAAIVSLQAEQTLMQGYLRSADAATDTLRTRLLALQAQLQAITQEMREKAGECMCLCHREHDNLCLECCDGGSAQFADRLAALGKEQP